MKLTTLRNLMASMLVIGVAGSVVGVGSGTFALFNATTTNTGNTFTSDDLQITDAVDGGSSCTGKASTSSTTGTCDVIVTLSNIIPGDSKFGTFKITNASSHAAFDLKLDITQHGGSGGTVLDSNPAADATNAGLGLILFRCLAGSTAVSCTSSSLDTLHPIYGSCGGDITLGTAQAFSTAILGPADTGSNKLPVGSPVPGAANCTPGNTAAGISAVTINPITGPDTAGHYNFGTADNIAAVVFLPGKSGNAVAGKSGTNLDFLWTATQVVGGPR
jgi:hypothetical protein